MKVTLFTFAHPAATLHGLGLWMGALGILGKGKKEEEEETAMQMGKKKKKGWERKGRTKTALGEKGTNWTADSGAPLHSGPKQNKNFSQKLIPQ